VLFYICLDAHNVWGTTNGLKIWAGYLFPTLEGIPEEIQVPATDEHITAKMASSGHGDVVLEEDVGAYEIGDSFKSFYHQASRPMSRRALLKMGFYQWCFSLLSN